MKYNIKEVCEIAKEAGQAILELYRSDHFDVEIKGDNSPLTRADKASHEIIEKGLSKLTPDRACTTPL